MDPAIIAALIMLVTVLGLLAFGAPQAHSTRSSARDRNRAVSFFIWFLLF